MASQEQEKTPDAEGLAVASSFDTTQKINAWLQTGVKEPERRIVNAKLKINDTYVVYLVVTKIIDQSKVCEYWHSQHEESEMPSDWGLWRRYSEFDLLRDYLMAMYPMVVIPPLPEKRSTTVWQASIIDKADPEFVERRRVALDQFFKRILDIPEFANDRVIFSFLKDEEESWKEVLNQTNYQEKINSRLKAISAGYRIKNPNEKFEQVKKYAVQLESHLNTVLRTRARTAEHLFGIHKIHANYGREFSDISVIERPELADGLQKIGQYIDTFAQDIDISIESEEDFADQLKEYHGYCDSLKAICRKQELMQLEYEQLAASVEQARRERDNFSEGKTGLLGGLKAKVFGGPSQEQKDQKLEELRNAVDQLEQRENEVSTTNKEWESEALENINKWHEQKVKDIQDIMINYIVVTLDRCKKSRTLWANIQASCEAM